MPSATTGYRPPVHFVPHQVMRQHHAPGMPPRPAFAYNNWTAANPAAYGAYAHQPAMPQHVAAAYGQAGMGMWGPPTDQSASGRSDAKWKTASPAVISAPPNVLAAPQTYTALPQPVAVSQVQLDSVKSTIKFSANVAKPAASVSSATKASTAPSASKPSASDEAAKSANADGTASTSGGNKKKVLRTAAGKTWEDPTLADWDPSDFRIFVGDLGNEATDEMLARLFNGYPSFQRARVVRDPRTNKVKGYGFVSFRDPKDFLRAMKEVNGRYCGNRPVKLRKSVWKDRSIPAARKREKEKQKLGLK